MRDRDGAPSPRPSGRAVGLLPDPGAAAMSRPFGRKPYGRAAAARSGCPASAGRRYPPLRCVDDRACKRGPDPSSVPGILSPVQITVKGAPAARRLLAQPQTLDCDLPRQDHRHLSVGRGSPSPAVPTSAERVSNATLDDDLSAGPGTCREDREE